LNTKSYLERINYEGPTGPDPVTLRELHRAHMLAVPFENLDIHTGRQILLDESRVLSKIVDGRRGGFCYELNGAFAALLRELGFQVRLLSADVATADGGFSPPFDHLALLVELEQRWLADVGFGDSFREPLLLDYEGEQRQGDEAYRIIRGGEYLILERRDASGSWKPQYRFTLDAYDYSDFQQMCHYHQTSPESPFTQRRTCTLATPEGRITLTGMRLITTAQGEKHERALADREEYLSVLKERFGIELAGHEFEL
jgi:N-hydroxyarylamine O-acetyltransferase